MQYGAEKHAYFYCAVDVGIPTRHQADDLWDEGNRRVWGNRPHVWESEADWINRQLIKLSVVKGNELSRPGRRKMLTVDRGLESELVSRSERYPVHFQQNARFSLRISKGGVREAGAETQEAPLEATSFLCHAISVILQKIFSLRAFLVILLLCVIISWETEAGIGWDKWNKICFNLSSSLHWVEVLLLCKKVSRCWTYSWYLSGSDLLNVISSELGRITKPATKTTLESKPKVYWQDRLMHSRAFVCLKLQLYGNILQRATSGAADILQEETSKSITKRSHDKSKLGWQHLIGASMNNGCTQREMLPLA